MSEPNIEPLDQAVDPPDNNGGTGKTVAILSPDLAGTDQQAVDPPDNNGGTKLTTAAQPTV